VVTHRRLEEEAEVEEVACSGAGEEVTACSEAGDKAAVCSKAGITDSRWRRL
jgi:hypothetical protein